MTADEIRDLGAAAGITGGTRVLDLCCGRGGPGRLLTRELGCDLLGLDASERAVAAARAGAGDLACRYEVGHVPPLPPGRVDVVLLLETMLAFRDKTALLQAVHSVLEPGGRFAFTVEEGEPLTQQETATMPAAETVWPIRWASLRELLERAGFIVAWQQDRTGAHGEVVDSLLTEFTARQSVITTQIGREQLEHLLTSHRMWSDWLSTGRIRKFAVVATARVPGSGQPTRAGHRSDRA